MRYCSTLRRGQQGERRVGRLGAQCLYVARLEDSVEAREGGGRLQRRQRKARLKAEAQKGFTGRGTTSRHDDEAAGATAREKQPRRLGLGAAIRAESRTREDKASVSRAVHFDAEWRVAEECCEGTMAILQVDRLGD
eukprot:6214807-Pleurochrysis_carterae.AAC.11